MSLKEAKMDLSQPGRREYKLQYNDVGSQRY